MTIEAQKTVTDTTTEGQPSTAPGTGASNGQPNGGNANTQPKTEAEKPKAKTEAEKPKPLEGTPAPEAKKAKKLSGDDDEIPEEEDLVQMSPRALKARLDRASKKQLVDAFGTSDIDAIKAKLAAGDEYEKKKEEDRKAALTAEQKLKEERDTALNESKELKTKLEREQLARVIEKQDGRITRIAEKHLDPDYITSELPILARAIDRAAKKGDRKLAKNEDAWIANWFAERVKNKPKLGKDFGVQETQPEVKKLPFTNGASGSRPQQGTSGTSGAAKTARPGQPNSMTDKELREQGYSYK